MIWQDLLVDRWVNTAALRASTAAAFDVPDAHVAIVDSPEQLDGVPPSARIVLERTRQCRDLPLAILVILRDDELVERVTGFEGALRVTRKLAHHLGAAVLFAEGALSPSEWVRVHPTGTVDLVSLDVDDEDAEEDSFVVVSERPFPVNPQRSESSTTRVTA